MKRTGTWIASSRTSGVRAHPIATLVAAVTVVQVVLLQLALPPAAPARLAGTHVPGDAGDAGGTVGAPPPGLVEGRSRSAGTGPIDGGVAASPPPVAAAGVIAAAPVQGETRAVALVRSDGEARLAEAVHDVAGAARLPDSGASAAAVSGITPSSPAPAGMVPRPAGLPEEARRAAGPEVSRLALGEQTAPAAPGEPGPAPARSLHRVASKSWRSAPAAKESRMPVMPAQSRSSREVFSLALSRHLHSLTWLRAGASPSGRGSGAGTSGASPEAPPAVLHSSRWLLSQPEGAFTLQLARVRDWDAIPGIVRRHRLAGDLARFRSRHRGHGRNVLVAGVYPSREAAEAAAAAIAPVRGLRPAIVPLAEVQAEIRSAQPGGGSA